MGKQRPRGLAAMKPDAFRTLIDGEPVSPVSNSSTEEVEPGVYSILVDGASHEVRIEAVRVDAGHVTVGNRSFDYQVDDPRQWKRSGDAAGVQGRLRRA